MQSKTIFSLAYLGGYALITEVIVRLITSLIEDVQDVNVLKVFKYNCWEWKKFYLQDNWNLHVVHKNIA